MIESMSLLPTKDLDSGQFCFSAASLASSTYFLPADGVQGSYALSVCAVGPKPAREEVVDELTMFHAEPLGTIQWGYLFQMYVRRLWRHQRPGHRSRRRMYIRCGLGDTTICKLFFPVPSEYLVHRGEVRLRYAMTSSRTTKSARELRPLPYLSTSTVLIIREWIYESYR